MSATSFDLTVAGAIAGDIVMGTAVSGVGALATGNPDPSGYPLLGVMLDGDSAEPLNGNQIINCSSAPTMNRMLYVDLSNPGKASPTAGGQRVGVAIRNLSVGATYQALVNCSSASASADGEAITVTDPGTSTAGQIVRGTGVTGTITPAIADTSAHAAGVLGLYDGSVVRPMQGAMVGLFDADPTAGLHGPAYLSATVAGDFSITSTPIGLNAYGTITRIVSASAPYSAEVLFGRTSESDAGNKEEVLLLDTVARLGGTKSDYSVLFDDFERTTSDHKTPTWGTGSGVLTKMFNSVLSCNQTGSWIITNIVSNYVSEKIRLSFRMKIHNGAGWSCCGIVVAGNSLLFGVSDTAQCVGTKFYVFNNISHPGDSPTVGATAIEVGTRDTNWHTIDFEVDGAGKARYRFDGGAWSAQITLGAGSAGASIYPIRASGAGAIDTSCDYIFYAVKNR